MGQKVSDTARLEAAACMWEAVLNMMSTTYGSIEKQSQIEGTRERITALA